MAGPVPQRLSRGSGWPNEGGQRENPRRKAENAPPEPLRLPQPMPPLRSPGPPGRAPQEGRAQRGARPGPAPSRPSAPGGGAGAGRSRPGRFLGTGAGGDRSPPRRLRVRLPPWPRSSRRRRWTVSGCPGRPRRQRPPPALARPRARGGPGRGSGAAGARRGSEPRAPRPSGGELAGRGAGGPGPGPPAVSHRRRSGRAPGRAGPGTAGRGEPGPAAPGRGWGRRRRRRSSIARWRRGKQTRPARSCWGPGGAGTRAVPLCGSHVQAAGAAPARPAGLWKQLGLGSL